MSVVTVDCPRGCGGLVQMELHPRICDLQLTHAISWEHLTHAGLDLPCAGDLSAVEVGGIYQAALECLWGPDDD